MVNLAIDPRVEIIQGALYLGTTYNGNQTSVSFYNAQSIGGTHVAEYSVDITSKIANYRENEDLSIEFDYLGVESVRVHTTMATNQRIVNVTYVLDVDKNLNGNLSEIFRHTVDLSEHFDTGIINFNSSKHIHVKLEAGETYSTPDVKLLRFRSLTGVIDDEFNFYLGTNLFRNTNEKPKELKPWAIRKNNEFKTLDRDSGFFQIRNSMIWVDKSKQLITDIGKENSGTHRIRKNSWVGQNKIGNE